MREKNYKGIVILVMLSLIFLWLIIKAKKIVLIFMVGLVLAYLLEPIIKYLQRQGLKRLFAILLLYLLIIVLVVGFSAMFLPYLSKEIVDLINLLPKYTLLAEDWYAYVEEMYNKYFADIMGSEKLVQYFDEVKASIFSMLSVTLKGASNFISASVFWLLVPIISFYLLKDKEIFVKWVFNLLPIRRENEWRSLFKQLDKTLKGFLKGSVLVGLFIAVANSIGFYLVGLSFPLVFGLIAGIFNIIPYFGPFIGGVPAVVVALFDRPIMVVYVILVIFITQQIESHFITPKIMGDKLGVHPLVIMFALLVSAVIGGIWLMVLAVPICGVLRVIIGFIIDESIVVKK